MGLKERIQAIEVESPEASVTRFEAAQLAAEADELMAEMSGALLGLLEWCGPIAGDDQMKDEAEFEEETVRCARSLLEKYNQYKDQTND